MGGLVPVRARHDPQQSRAPKSGIRLPAQADLGRPVRGAKILLFRIFGMCDVLASFRPARGASRERHDALGLDAVDARASCACGVAGRLGRERLPGVQDERRSKNVSSRIRRRIARDAVDARFAGEVRGRPSRVVPAPPVPGAKSCESSRRARPGCEARLLPRRRWQTGWFTEEIAK